MKPDFFLIPTIVKEQKDLRPSDWFVYATVYWLEHMAGARCFASNATIAKAAGMGERTVSRALENLEKCGFIEREFVDSGKTRRAQIHARVMFSQTPSLFAEGRPNGQPDGKVRVAQVGDPGRPGGRQNSNTEVVRKTAATSAAPATPFNAEATKQKWYDGEDARFQLLAWFFDKKNLWHRFDTRAKVEAATQRHVRAATRLVRGEWSQAECNSALRRMLEANPKMRDEWQLETLEKYLTK